MIGIFLSFIPWSFLIPVILLIGIFGFYEGIPGAIYVPYVGQYFAGRVGHAYLRGQTDERLAWEDRRKRDLALAASRLAEAQNKIDALDSEYWRSKNNLATQISDLEHALEAEKADNAKDAAGTCHSFISRRLRNSLQTIGN